MDLSIFRRLKYRVSAGKFVGGSNLHFADFEHFNTQPVCVILNERDGAFMLLPYYTYSTNREWAQIGLTYSAPFIALKYLPFFSNLYWNEGVFLNSIVTNNLPWYVELGYGITEILDSFKLAGYVGFFQTQMPVYGFRFGYNIGGKGITYP